MRAGSPCSSFGRDGLAPLFPLVPGSGPCCCCSWSIAAVSFAWSGAQTLIAPAREGDTGYIGGFFFARLGKRRRRFSPARSGTWRSLAGLSLGAAWGAVLTIALLHAGRRNLRAATTGRVGQARFRPRRLAPSLDYISSIMLIAIHAIALSMAIMSMRNTTYSIRPRSVSFYLDGVGLVDTMIGILFATPRLQAGSAPLFAGRAMRLGDPHARC